MTQAMDLMTTADSEAITLIPYTILATVQLRNIILMHLIGVISIVLIINQDILIALQIDAIKAASIICQIIQTVLINVILIVLYISLTIQIVLCVILTASIFNPTIQIVLYHSHVLFQTHATVNVKILIHAMSNVQPLIHAMNSVPRSILATNHVRHLTSVMKIVHLLISVTKIVRRLIPAMVTAKLIIQLNVKKAALTSMHVMKNVRMQIRQVVQMIPTG